MPTDWEDVLVAYLHDPPDKALAIRGHVERAARYLAAALDEQAVERHRLKIQSDPLAAVAVAWLTLEGLLTRCQTASFLYPGGGREPPPALAARERLHGEEGWLPDLCRREDRPGLTGLHPRQRHS